MEIHVVLLAREVYHLTLISNKVFIRHGGEQNILQRLISLFITRSITKKKFLKKTKDTLSKVSFRWISLMPNQVAFGRTGEDTWVAALIVPEMFTDLSS